MKVGTQRIKCDGRGRGHPGHFGRIRRTVHPETAWPVTGASFLLRHNKSMLDQPPPRDDLFVRSEIARFESLQTDLELCQTLVAIAHTEHEIGDPIGVAQAREKAETGFTTITRLAWNIEDPELRDKIQIGLGKLRVALDGLAANQSRGAAG